MRNSLPVWLAWAQAIALIVIPFVGVWIALRQMRIAEMKVKHDLFDRRIVVFDATTKFLGSILRLGKVDEAEWASYMRATANAEFLFNDNVKAYLDSLRNRAAEALALQVEMSEPSENPAENRQDLIRKKYDALRFFVRQLEKGELQDQFRPFLRFERRSRFQMLNDWLRGPARNRGSSGKWASFSALAKRLRDLLSAGGG